MLVAPLIVVSTIALFATGVAVLGLTAGIAATPLADHWQDRATSIVGVDVS